MLIILDWGGAILNMCVICDGTAVVDPDDIYIAYQLAHVKAIDSRSLT